MMFLFFLLLIGVPLLIIALVTGGGLAALFRSRPRQSPPNTPPPAQSTPFRGEPVEPNYVRKCPTCGRGVKVDWNICPSCGAALT
ncbi:MAG: hypothetical protein ACE5GO_00625 [Anaerolineales bacterium]